MGIDHSNPYIHSTTVLCDTSLNSLEKYAYGATCSTHGTLATCTCTFRRIKVERKETLSTEDIQHMYTRVRHRIPSLDSWGWWVKDLLCYSSTPYPTTYSLLKYLHYYTPTLPLNPAVHCTYCKGYTATTGTSVFRYGSVTSGWHQCVCV